MKMANLILMSIWRHILPIAVCMFTIVTALELFKEGNDEVGFTFLNIACLLSCVYVLGHIVNIIVEIASLNAKEENK